jgi:molybdopterin converting factor small subunit
VKQFKISSGEGEPKDSKKHEVETPVKLEQALQKLEEKLNLKLPSHSILILVNGVEASILGGNDAIINENDEVVIVPMFHGG